MYYVPNFRIAGISDAKAGDKFYLLYRNQNYFCIKLHVTGDERSDSFIMLHPGHPMTPGDPAVLRSSVVRSNPIVIVDDASLVVNPSLSSLNFGRTTEVPIGSLYFINDDVGISVWIDRSVSQVFSINTGLEINLDAQHFVAFPNWRCVVPGIDGSVCEICAR